MDYSSLRIPPRYRSGLRALAGLGDEGIAQISETLRSIPHHLTTARLAEEIEASLPGVPSSKAEDLVETVLSLVSLLPEEASSAEELARDVAWSKDLELEDAERDRFAEQLADVLNLDALVLAARALDVVTEFERAFHDARVLVDIRPVFGRDAAQGPRAAVVVANLKIDYHQGGEPLKEIYFAMDQMDLLRLRVVVDRALTKTRSLKSLIDQVNLPYWEFREPPDATDS